MWYCTACSLLHIFPQIKHVCPGPQFCLINSCSSAYRSEIRNMMPFRICILDVSTFVSGTHGCRVHAVGVLLVLRVLVIVLLAQGGGGLHREHRGRVSGLGLYTGNLGSLVILTWLWWRWSCSCVVLLVLLRMLLLVPSVVA